MPTAQANLRHLNKTVAGWIADAAGRVNGAALLTKKAAVIGEQIAVLGRDRALPESLEGLTCHDLYDAQYALEKAARAQAARLVAFREGQAQRVAA